MNEVSLDKIIKNIVYPKYPYIVDHEINVNHKEWWVSWGIERSSNYTVDLYVGKKEIEGVDMEEVLKTMDNAKKLVMQLFQALGPDKYETLYVNYSLNEYRE